MYNVHSFYNIRTQYRVSSRNRRESHLLENPHSLFTQFNQPIFSSPVIQKYIEYIQYSLTESFFCEECILNVSEGGDGEGAFPLLDPP